jgi:vancomycin resistance protein YoaR
MAALDSLQEAEIQLLVHETQPRIDDTSTAAQEIQQIMNGPMTLYLQEPLAGVDLERVTIPVEDLAAWIRVITVEDEQGKATTQVILDENALRAWLRPYAELLQRDPTNARYYFDDNTQELVLVEAHVSGRALDIDATAEQFLKQVRTPNRSMPFILKEIVPTVHAGATGEELGITELVSESTTWFYGSSPERMHNIAQAASNFYGIVIAPGEEFSFNNFLGEVSAEQGYEQGLIIFGGRTIEGVGGGVCQVSTTAFQAAFWAGFPIVERWQHGYQVGYYDDGEGPGMDATVYSPLVDLRFINDTPYHLLIENYYSEANSSLTFKFYSTGLGREIIKDDPIIANVVPPKPDVWEFNEELEEGEIEQVDWAVEGADVTVGRTVLNASGELIRQDTFVSNYIPWQNIYQYGPGVELPTPEAPTPTIEADES